MRILQTLRNVINQYPVEAVIGSFLLDRVLAYRSDLGIHLIDLAAILWLACLIMHLQKAPRISRH